MGTLLAMAVARINAADPASASPARRTRVVKAHGLGAIILVGSTTPLVGSGIVAVVGRTIRVVDLPRSTISTSLLGAYAIKVAPSAMARR